MPPIDTDRLPMFIDGESVRSEAGADFVNTDPATGNRAGLVCLSSSQDVDRAVDAAARALRGPWGCLPLTRRLALLEAVAAGIERQAQRFIEAEIRDTGRPRWMATEFDIPRAAATFREFARMAANHPGESRLTDTADDAGAISFTLRMPLGVVGLICPWNLPLVLLAWKLAPALAAGNTVVVKPAEESPTSATLLAEVIKSAGIPDGVYNVVHGYGKGSTGEALVRHPNVAGLSFTGESATGKLIMATAAPSLKKLSFELGGKNAAVIFADTDLDQALPTIAHSVFHHAGQLCLSMERIYVQRPLYQELVERLAQASQQYIPGGPTHPATRIGPLISSAQRDKVLSYINLAVSDGGAVLVGGGIPNTDPPYAGGFFVSPTVLVDVPASSRAWSEEIFGPVCTVAPFDDEEEAVALVNSTDYGLCACVWTRDLALAGRMARQLEVGVLWLNAWLIRDLRTPFGGVRHSGIGRAGGGHSLDFFSELRSVTMKL